MAETHSAHQSATAEIGALRELKEVEASARELRAEARRDAERTVEQAIEDARRIRDEAETKSRTEYEAHLEKARSQTEVEAEGIIAGGRSEAESIRAKTSGAEFDAAVEMVLTAFRERSGAD